jgi:hypothetical protein
MKYNIETELISSEIGFLKPRKSKAKEWIENIVCVAAIAGATYLLIILAAAQFAATKN